jgi:hypothetical protein
MRPAGKAYVVTELKTHVYANGDADADADEHVHRPRESVPTKKTSI